MGRELHRMGAPFKQPEWSALALMLAPDTVSQAHRRFVEAGAEVITTNSYALVPFHIGDRNSESVASAVVGSNRSALLLRLRTTAVLPAIDRSS